MQSKRILIFGGCMLAFGAAFANTGFVLRTGTSVSHLTGDIARLSIDLTRWSPAAIRETLAVSTATLSFLAGATLTGFVLHHPSMDISRPYGRSISGIGVLFLLSSWFIARIPLAAIGLAAFACGFQNAMATRYRGLVLRTTHLTGVFTDLGSNLGMKVRGHDVSMWRITVPALLIVSFLAGAASAAGFELLHLNTILISGIAYCVGGAGWTIWKHGFLLPRRIP